MKQIIKRIRRTIKIFRILKKRGDSWVLEYQPSVYLYVLKGLKENRFIVAWRLSLDLEVKNDGIYRIMEDETNYIVGYKLSLS